MKTIIVYISVFFMALTGVMAQDGMDRFKVQVDGLGCPFCAYGLEKKFKEFKGIEDVKINIETGDFTFAYPAEKQLTLEAVEKQVEKAGYTPISGEVTRTDGSIEAMHGGADTPVLDVKNKLTETTRVAGNCGMCKARIEKAASSQTGVFDAIWDKDSKQLMVTFDQTRTSLEAVEKAIARAGHDTENHKAHKDSYDNLPGCCHYERIDPKGNN